MNAMHLPRYLKMPYTHTHARTHTVHTAIRTIPEKCIQKKKRILRRVRKIVEEQEGRKKTSNCLLCTLSNRERQSERTERRRESTSIGKMIYAHISSGGFMFVGGGQNYSAKNIEKTISSWILCHLFCKHKPHYSSKVFNLIFN